MQSLIARLQAHDFGPATFVRWGDEARWVSFLRGIILALEGSKRHPPEARAFFAEHTRECENHLRALGLTRAQAKALVFPEPEKLSRPLRRSYGVSLRRNVQVPAARTRAARAPRRTAAPASVEANAPEPEPDLPGAAPDARLGSWDALPPVLRVEDLAGLFGVSQATARRHLTAGDYGSRFKSGRRWYLRTEDLRAHLETIAEAPPPPQVRDASVRKWQARFDRARSRRQS